MTSEIYAQEITHSYYISSLLWRENAQNSTQFWSRQKNISKRIQNVKSTIFFSLCHSFSLSSTGENERERESSLLSISLEKKLRFDLEKEVFFYRQFHFANICCLSTRLFVCGGMWTGESSGKRFVLHHMCYTCAICNCMPSCFVCPDFTFTHSVSNELLRQKSILWLHNVSIGCRQVLNGWRIRKAENRAWSELRI